MNAARWIAVCVAGQLLTGCASDDKAQLKEEARQRRQAEVDGKTPYRNPQGFVEGPTIETIDARLRREFRWPNSAAVPAWGVVLPITGALLDTLFITQSRKQGEPEEQIQESSAVMRKLLVDQHSCFDIFLNAAQSGDMAQYAYYQVTYANAGGETVEARPIEKLDLPYAVESTVKTLVNHYVPTQRMADHPRSIMGYGAYSRGIVCGPHVDFTQAFSVTLTPRFGKNLPGTTVTWAQPKPPAPAQPAAQ
jgi:hypothetical protein